MEKGLLSRLQGYFRASFGGRYVEHLIKETIQEQPKLATRLFGVKCSDSLLVEHRFRIADQTRIADLAFFDADTERVTCLVEIKYDDHKNPKNAAQLQHYLQYCRKQNCKFIILSQHILSDNLQQKLRHKKELMLFSELAGRLESSESSVGGLLRRFFVDRGLMMHVFKDRDLANLKSFLFRLVNPWGGQGRSQTKDAMSGGAAEAFGNLLKNMNIIAREVVTNESRRAPTIDFELDPWIEPKRVQKDARENPKDKSISALGAKAGGHLSVFGRIRLDDTSKNWLQIEFGIGLEAESGKRNFQPFSFAAVHSKDNYIHKPKDASVKILHDKQRAAAALKDRIREAIGDAIQQDFPRNQIMKLKRFRNELK